MDATERQLWLWNTPPSPVPCRMRKKSLWNWSIATQSRSSSALYEDRIRSTAKSLFSLGRSSRGGLGRIARRSRWAAPASSSPLATGGAALAATPPPTVVVWSTRVRHAALDSTPAADASTNLRRLLDCERGFSAFGRLQHKESTIRATPIGSCLLIPYDDVRDGLVRV
jgi:hypothetical protein